MIKFLDNPRNYWIRWIALLPLSIISLLLVFSLFSLINYLSAKFYFGNNSDSWMVLYIYPITSSYLSGAAYILTGEVVAPSFKRNSCIILLVILSIILGVSFVGTIAKQEYKVLINGAAQLIGALVTFINLKKFDK